MMETQDTEVPAELEMSRIGNWCSVNFFKKVNCIDSDDDSDVDIDALTWTSMSTLTPMPNLDLTSSGKCSVFCSAFFDE